VDRSSREWLRRISASSGRLAAASRGWSDARPRLPLRGYNFLYKIKIEAVLRLVWPDAFARACAERDVDAATTGWREGAAPAG
jgi:hypothetical protein